MFLIMFDCLQSAIFSIFKEVYKLFIIWVPLMNADRVLHTYILMHLYLFASKSEGLMRVLSKSESIDAVLFNGVI